MGRSDGRHGMVHQFTFGHPRDIGAPAFWMFLNELVGCFPAMVVILAVYTLGPAFVAPYTVDVAMLGWLAVAAGVLVVVQYAVEMVSYWFTYHRAYRETAAKRKAYVAHLRELPLGFFSSKRSGDLISSFGDDFANVEYAMCYWLPFPIGVGALLALCFVGLLAFDWRMALALYALLPVSMVLSFVAGRVKKRFRTDVLSAKAQAATQLSAYLRGMKELKAHRMTGAGFEALEHAYGEVKRASMRDELVAGTATFLASAVTRFVVPATVAVGMYALLGGSIDPLDYIVCVIVATKLASPLMMLSQSVSALQNMAASGERLDAVMSEPAQGGSESAGAVEGYAFDRVAFSYGAAAEGESALRAASFDVPARHLTALVGPSGSGKSTCVRLMARFWDAQGGTVFAKGPAGASDVRELQADSLLGNVSMVMQDAYLFRGTIRDNLCFGRAIPDDVLLAACRDASCLQFVEALPEGLDTQVGEGGATLSGGERQRLALARALLKDAPVLLLDEPTASLDADNEALVQRALDRIARDRTVVMIAHRLKTVRSASSIVVVEGGRIAERGTHDGLLRQGGIYARLWELQTAAHALRFAQAGAGASEP